MNNIVTYVTEQTLVRGRGPMHQLSISVNEIANALDIDEGAVQTAVRKAWIDGWLHIDVCDGDDCAHSVILGERR